MWASCLGKEYYLGQGEKCLSLHSRKKYIKDYKYLLCHQNKGRFAYHGRFEQMKISS